MSSTASTEDESVLASLHQELLDRGHLYLELVEATTVAAARQLLGMDGQPCHDVRLRFPDSVIEERIRGNLLEEAVANARWTWPSALVEYLGRSYEVGHQVLDSATERRAGEVTAVCQGPDPKGSPRLLVRFVDSDQDVEVTRDQIRRPHRLCVVCLDLLGGGPDDCGHCDTIRAAM